MGEVGYLAAVGAFAAATYAAVASALGAGLRVGPLVVSGRRAFLASAALTTAAVLALVVAFLRHDFTLSYVWQTSSLTSPRFYLLTGLWGGQSGSLLFWSWMTVGIGAAAVVRRWRADAALLPWYTAVMAGITSFYLFLVVAVSNPFERLPVVPTDGNGLNPLLQHPGMAFHPPALYAGLTGLTVPFAFAMAALLSGRLETGWIHASRRWMLIGWASLSVGLALGGRWAYDVLGWGGYWGWDPVENAALMPWIAATAYLHSVMVQERREMFRVWNMGLIILTYSLTVIGTFLTRAGLVSSVHAFAQSDIGPYFLVFTAVVTLGSLALLWHRLPQLRDSAHIEATVSRETAFLANNVLLLGALFAVFLGTLFPLVSEIVTDQRVTVGPPYFNTVVGPILAALILLMGIGPVVGWRKADPWRVARALWRPAAASLIIVAVLFAMGVHRWIALVGLATCTFALFATLLEFSRGLQARIARGEAPWTAMATLLARSRRRYGGYTVHLGVVLLGMGVIGSMVYQQETERSLSPGEALTLGGYRLTYRGVGTAEEPDKLVVFARMDVDQGGRTLGTLEPSKQVFRLREDQPRTIPAVMHRPLEDVYVLFGAFDEATQRVTLKVYVNPLISLVWLGMIVLVAGTLVAAWPDRQEARVLNAELVRLLGATGAAR